MFSQRTAGSPWCKQQAHKNEAISYEIALLIGGEEQVQQTQKMLYKY